VSIPPKTYNIYYYYFFDRENRRESPYGITTFNIIHGKKSHHEFIRAHLQHEKKVHLIIENGDVLIKNSSHLQTCQTDDMLGKDEN
jgi:hypothetical protein